jgi:ParB family chromosome partitioning protein
MEAAAREIATEQSFRQSGDEEPISGADVVARLIKATTSRTGRVQKATIEANGSTIGQVERDRARGLTITLNPTDLSADDILEALRPLIERAKIMKRSARQ